MQAIARHIPPPAGSAGPMPPPESPPGAQPDRQAPGGEAAPQDGQPQGAPPQDASPWPPLPPAGQWQMRPQIPPPDGQPGQPAQGQPLPSGGKGPLRVADTAQPTRQLPEWVPGQPPASAGQTPGTLTLDPSKGPMLVPESLPRYWHMNLQHGPAATLPPAAERAGGHQPTPIA